MPAGGSLRSSAPAGGAAAGLPFLRVSALAAGPACCTLLQVPVQKADGGGAAYMCTNALYFLANLPPCESWLQNPGPNPCAEAVACALALALPRSAFRPPCNRICLSPPCCPAADIEPEAVRQLELYKETAVDMFDGTPACYPGEAPPAAAVPAWARQFGLDPSRSSPCVVCASCSCPTPTA